MSLARSVKYIAQRWLLLGLLLPFGLQAEPGSTATGRARGSTHHPGAAVERLVDPRRPHRAHGQGSVAAQTAGRVSQITVDVNDVVPAGQLFIEITTTSQSAGLIRPKPRCRPPDPSNATRIASWHA